VPVPKNEIVPVTVVALPLEFVNVPPEFIFTVPELMFNEPPPFIVIPEVLEGLLETVKA
jgi:hypothetical protein